MVTVSETAVTDICENLTVVSHDVFAVVVVVVVAAAAAAVAVGVVFELFVVILWLLNIPTTCNAYLRTGSAQTSVRASTLR